MILREKDKETLIQLFSGVDKPLELIAYGSRVNNTAHEGSDLDLVIRTQTEEPISINLYSDLVEKIKQSNIPFLVELRDWSTLPTSFHKQISENSQVIFTNII